MNACRTVSPYPPLGQRALFRLIKLRHFKLTSKNIEMVAGINGKHEHPDFSEIVLESPNWGKP
jgi:hypothetical protein